MQSETAFGEIAVKTGKMLHIKCTPTLERARTSRHWHVVQRYLVDDVTCVDLAQHTKHYDAEKPPDR